MRNIIALSLVFCLVACAQATRHSNTLLFTTNTVGGLKLGVDEKQIPQILIGYTRFEGVFMPLVANTGVDGKRLTPCPIEGQPGGQNLLPPDCLLLGENGDEDKDAYSVLATFSGNATAEGGDGGNASGSVAQYFATGIAARELAVRAGAAAIATGDAARVSAERSELQTLLKNPDVLQLAQAKAQAKDKYVAVIESDFDKLPGDTESEKIAELGTRADIPLKDMGYTTKEGFLNWLKNSASEGEAKKLVNVMTTAPAAEQ